VDGEVPWNADDPLGQCYDLRPGVDEIQVAGFRTLSQVVQQTGIQLPPMPEPGQAPGDPADLAIGHAEHLGCFPQGHAGLEKDMAGDHGRMAGKTVSTPSMTVSRSSQAKSTSMSGGSLLPGLRNRPK
jgi:hypothetical protein